MKGGTFYGGDTMIIYMGKAICENEDEASTIATTLKTIPETVVEQNNKMVYVSYHPTEDTTNELQQKCIIRIKKILSVVHGSSYFCSL